MGVCFSDEAFKADFYLIFLALNPPPHTYLITLMMDITATHMMDMTVTHDRS